MRLDALMSSFIHREYKARHTVSGWESQYEDTEFVFGVSVVVVLFCFNETGGKNSHSQAEFKANAFESDPGNFFFLCNFSELISTKTSALCISWLLSKDKQNRYILLIGLVRQASCILISKISNKFRNDIGTLG